MATYYVRISGNDANAGTSAGAAWRTLSKAFTTVSAGDQVYIGAGTYREALTISTAWASETKFTGDYTGEHTGDAGIVYWTSYTKGDRARGGVRPLTTSGTPRYWTFENIVFAGGSSSRTVVMTPRDFTFNRCTFLPSQSLSNNNIVDLTATVDTAINTSFNSCLFLNGWRVQVSLPTSTVADYDTNIQFNTCMFSAAGVFVIGTGANSFKGGGIDFKNCTLISISTTVQFQGTAIATSIPSTFYNCLIVSTGGVGLTAGASGQIVEDYNVIAANTTRTNVTAGTHTYSDGVFLMDIGGYEWLYGLPGRPSGMPSVGSPFSYFGGTSVPSTDILGRTRTGNGAQWIDDGTATSGGANTLTDSGATWNTNELIGALILITSGTGSGQKKLIASNTATAITVFENWVTQPDNTSVYRIIRGPYAFNAQATAGSSTALTVSSATWDTNQWSGYTLEITSGTGSGQTTTVTSNNGTVLTVPTLTTAPDNTSVFSVYRQTSMDALLPAVGCFEAQQVGQRETVITDSGSTAMRIPGPGIHEFQLAVDASSTTVTVKGRYDARHGSTTKPQMQIVNGGGCGVSDATATMTAAVDTWEQLSLNFTPTSKGIVTVRVVSRADYPDGNAFFDTAAVS